MQNDKHVTPLEQCKLDESFRAHRLGQPKLRHTLRVNVVVTNASQTSPSRYPVNLSTNAAQVIQPLGPHHPRERLTMVDRWFREAVKFGVVSER